LSDKEQDPTIPLGREGKPLPEKVVEYIQKARDELKEYEEHKKYYEKKRKREIVLELIDLLQEYDYPKEWLRLIIAQELGEYISTSYIEKILAEKYPNEDKLEEQSTRQITEIPQNDDKIPMEVSSIGESMIGNNNDWDNTNHNSYDLNRVRHEEVATEFKSNLELQAEEGTKEIVRALQKQVNDLQTKCFQLDQLAKERAIWEEKCSQLQQQLNSYKDKIIKGITQIEFGSELLPIKVEYNFRTNQFSARVPEEAIERLLGVLRRQG
jgi:hypothetical protein